MRFPKLRAYSDAISAGRLCSSSCADGGQGLKSLPARRRRARARSSLGSGRAAAPLFRGLVCSHRAEPLVPSPDYARQAPNAWRDAPGAAARWPAARRGLGRAQTTSWASLDRSRAVTRRIRDNGRRNPGSPARTDTRSRFSPRRGNRDRVDGPWDDEGMAGPHSLSRPQEQQPRACCTGGQATVAKEQNTQQSPGLGRSSVRQPSHS